MGEKQNINRIESVRPLRGLSLEVGYTGGQVVTVNVAGLAEHFAVFVDLKKPTFFRRAKVADWDHTLEWPNGEGLDADRVMEMAIEQAGRLKCSGPERS